MSAIIRAWCACGWHGEYTSEAFAAYARRKHSCAKHEARRESARRRRARTHAIDRTPKPCLHKVAEHEHGTRACYVLDRCRCTPCATANSLAEKERLRRNAYGRNTMVDAAPARAHIETLQAAGMGIKTIAERSGVAHGALWKLVYGKTRPDGSRVPSRRVLAQTSQALLALAPSLTALAPSAVVSAAGTRRRLRALSSTGWSTPHIAAECGIDAQSLRATVAGRRDRVTVATARAVAGAYDRLWDRPPPEGDQRERIAASRARGIAARAGWPMPLDLDDATIDDPHAPDPVRSSQATLAAAATDVDEWTHLVRSGEDPTRAAERIGVQLRSVERAAYRLNRADVLDLMNPGRRAA